MFGALDSLNLMDTHNMSSPFLRAINSPVSILVTGIVCACFINSVVALLISRMCAMPPVKTWRLLAFGLVSGIVKNVPFVIFGLVSEANFNWFLEGGLLLYPPYFLVLYYFLSVWLFKTPKDGRFVCAKLAYYINTLGVLVYCIVNAFFVYLWSNDPGDVAMRENIVMVSSTIINIGIVLVGVLLVSRGTGQTAWTNEAPTYSFVESVTAQRWAISAVYCIVVHVLCVMILQLLRLSSYIWVVVAGLTVGAVICLMAFLLSYNVNVANRFFRIYKRRDQQVELLRNSIERFRVVRHDYSNMMQVYDGYLQLKDYKNLQRYHESVFGTVQGAINNLELHKHFSDNPVFYALILRKIQQAESAGIFLNTVATGPMGRILMHPLDLAHLLGILLDNALEETKHTERKTINFSVAPYGKNSVLVSLSNPTRTRVDIEAMFKPYYSTKTSHAGLGVPEVRYIVNHTPGCEMQVEYDDAIKSITFSIELPFQPYGLSMPDTTQMPVYSLQFNPAQSDEPVPPENGGLGVSPSLN